MAMEACLLVDVGSAVPQLLPAQTSVHDVLEKVIAALRCPAAFEQGDERSWRAALTH
jgi:hypothetical protein